MPIDNSKIVHSNKSKRILEFVNSSNLIKISSIGTSCPDHFLRTKRLPLVLPSLSDLKKNDHNLKSIVVEHELDGSFRPGDEDIRGMRIFLLQFQAGR